MISRHAMMVALCFLSPSVSSAADDAQPVNGRVVDEAGRPVAGASVSAFWAANGLEWEQVEALRQSEPEKIWQAEGKMQPWGDARATTDADGRFSIQAPERKKAIWVYDRERRRGAVIVLDRRNPGKSVEVRLRPLVRVFGTNRLAGAGQPLKWSCTYLNMPYVENDPLDRRRSAICGSYKARFDFLVPPGTYEISATTDDPHAATVEDRTITVTGDEKEVDLGMLVLRPTIGLPERIENAKAKGTWGNYKDNLGKRPPRWHLTDARGMSKDAQLDDFRGKWVVLYFWSPNCAPCLGKQLPELMAFHEHHKAQADRFEILAFCCDFSETLRDIRGLERQLEPVKKAVWGGKDLPFPVLLDNTFQTYERFGLEGNGVSNLLLIDPQGRLIEGDLKTLARHIDPPGGSSR